MAFASNNLFPYQAFDEVAIFDQNYNQLFRDARAIKAVVKEEARLMEHPLESGATIVDHRVILPREIELSLILRPETFRDTYKALRQYFFNGTTLTVQTRTGEYTDQIISQMPHEETSEMADTVAIALTLKQFQVVQAEFRMKPVNPSHKSKTDRGTLQPKVVGNGTAASAAVRKIFY